MTPILHHNNETWSGGGGGTLGNIQTNGRYEAVYVSSAEEELKERVQQLEKDLDSIRGMLVELYNKCPKTMVNMGKKKNKEATVECENCGGLLW